MEIHVLKAQGLSERRIAKQLGISRNTVARYLEAPEAPRYKLREAKPTKLDPFKAYIEQRIAEARPEWIPAPAMLRELRGLGYSGQVRQLQDFMRLHKAALSPIRSCGSKQRQGSKCNAISWCSGAAAIRCTRLPPRWATAGGAGCASLPTNPPRLWWHAITLYLMRLAACPKRSYMICAQAHNHIRSTAAS
jgi:transposase